MNRKKHSTITAGDYYEDCSGHPCLCVSVDSDGDEIQGVSLVNGTYPRACSLTHCGVRKLTLAEAIHWKFFGPLDHEIPEKDRWWHWSHEEFWPEDEFLKPFRLDTTRKPNQKIQRTR